MTTATLGDRAKAALQRIRDGHAPMRIPADPTDPDVVITDLVIANEDLEKKLAHRCDRYETMLLPGVSFCRKDGARVAGEIVQARNEASAEAVRLVNTLAGVQKERDGLRFKLDNLAERFNTVEAERNELRRQLAAVKTDRDNVWTWEGGPDDVDANAPASLSCPVVMTADTLRGILAEVEETRKLFELQQKRMHEATAMWRAELPEFQAERENVLPDLGELLSWLMGQITIARAEAAGAGSLLLDVQGDCVNATKALNAVTQQRNELNTALLEADSKLREQKPFVDALLRDRARLTVASKFVADVERLAAHRPVEVGVVPWLESVLKARDSTKDELAGQVACLADALDRDTQRAYTALAQIRQIVRGAAWLLEGRGPYEWNDDRYKDEAGQIIRPALEICERALSSSGDLLLSTLRDVKTTAAKWLEGKLFEAAQTASVGYRRALWAIAASSGYGDGARAIGKAAGIMVPAAIEEAGTVAEDALGDFDPARPPPALS